ncbi:MAG: hypothetical protein GX850_05915 [Clostridiaceae bacterium]|jgi:glycosyl-4,4'-diaponeurosporenoate acyltransferase|nr:hypothetical protein [Clostridiaceae bacterium]
MRIIFLSDAWTILLCFIVWGVFQVSSALFCLKLPDRFLSPNSFFFKSHHFERDGRIYDRVFRVRSWKHLLPDGAAVWKKRGFKKRTMDDFSEDNLNRFLIESVRGELTHWLAIFPFWVFGFFVAPALLWIMLIYALVINFPCIITQRFNRPRIQRLVDKKSKT